MRYVRTVVFGAGLVAASIAAADEGAVGYRQKVMDAVGGTMQSMVAIAKKEVPHGGHLAVHARNMASLATVVPDVFPAGSSEGETDALPAITNVIPSSAAAAFMFPVALSVANSMGLNFMPFAMILMMGTSYAFINPSGYQTNLMVQGPGNYKFIDFVKIGVPLTILAGIVVLLLAPIVYGF